MSLGQFSGTHETAWCTPNFIFNEINKDYGPFLCDAAASKDNKKCDQFFDLESNGLKSKWLVPTWCNPPYDDIEPWVQKASIEAKLGITSCLLLPGSISTSWYHLALNNADHEQFKGRIQFIPPIGVKASTSSISNTLFIFSEDTVNGGIFLGTRCAKTGKRLYCPPGKLK